MTAHGSTTPFGRRPLSLAMVATQKLAQECPTDVTVHKWQVFRDICEGRVMLGVTERALAVLNALLSFHPDTTLTNDGDLVVYPSNAQLSLRAHGMAPATLRRHLAVLVDTGLVIRRDSPNGKRYVRRGEGGLAQAFGFDITPLVARAAEFKRLAEAARADRVALKLVRERITISRRDIAKMIALGMEEGMRGDWKRYHGAFLDLVARIPRTATIDVLQPLARAFDELAQQVGKILENHIKSENMSANESHSERHIQNSSTESPVSFEPSFRKSRVEERPEPTAAPTAGLKSFPLGMVLDACPDIVMYTKTASISNWRELRDVAGLVRGMLGISPSAYDDACEAMGLDDAAIIIAAILQKGEAIGSPGGYIRVLTDKARAGEFSIGPVLMALLRAKQREQKSA